MAEDWIDVMNLKDFVVNIITIRDLFYYGLKHENKKITKAQAGELMDAFLEEGHMMNELIEAVMGALAKSLGRNDNENNNNEEVEGE